MKLSEERKIVLWNAFLDMGETAIQSSHYKLAENCGTATLAEWKAFLQEPDVQKHIENEMEILAKASMNQIIAKAGTSNSTGQANLLGTIMKVLENNQEKSGNQFIYMHVPLSENQKHAQNVVLCDSEGKPCNSDPIK